jgi:hypothetical protein
MPDIEKPVQATTGSDTNEVGFDGVTVREAIASRTLEGVTRFSEHVKSGRLSFEDGHEAITILLEVTMPFCDPTTKNLLHQIQKQLDREALIRKEAGRDLAIAGGQLSDTFGDWGRGP